MRRVVVTVAAVAVLAGCGTAPGVPQWKDGVALPASPSVAGSEPAPAGSDGPAPAGVAAGSPVPAGPAPAVSPPEQQDQQQDHPGRQAGPQAPEEFTAAVRGRLPEVAVDRRPEEITEIGATACAGLSGGGQRRGTAVDDVADYGVSSAEARELVRLARAYLCP